MNDKIEKIGGTLLQHGKVNDRVYLMKFCDDDFPDIIDTIDRLCKENGYGKIFAKVPASKGAAFLNRGYCMEAYVPGFYQGLEDALFLTYYHDPERKKLSREHMETIQEVLNTIDAEPLPELDDSFFFRRAGPANIPEMAYLYSKVFPTYPFPIQEEWYLRETMEASVHYFGVWHQGNLVGLSSAETDPPNKNVEMTDFAVLPDYRGNQLALYMLFQMDNYMTAQGFLTAYTIARLHSPGMNVTFLKAGYRYSGTLINNTAIAGGLESMNVLYKAL